MNRYAAIILIAFIALFAAASVTGCGSNVKPPKYPGQDVPVGQKGENASPNSEEQKTEEAPASDAVEGGGAMFDMGTANDDDQGKSIEFPPINSEPLSKPLQAEEGGEDTGNGDEEASSGDGSAEEETATEEKAGEEKADEKEAAEEWPEGTSHHDKTPAKFENLGDNFGFSYLNPDESQIGKVNELIKAIEILTVNEMKYDYAEGFLTPEAEGLSRGDPLFIPEAVPDELRPLFEGEGIGGSVDDELQSILESQIQADLRVIPINIIGIMEQGGRRVAIGRLNYSQGFRVAEGETTYFWYSGSYVIGLTGVMITEDLVILNLQLYQWSPWGVRAVTDPVPRSFHIGIT